MLRQLPPGSAQLLQDIASKPYRNHQPRSHSENVHAPALQLFAARGIPQTSPSTHQGKPMLTINPTTGPCVEGHNSAGHYGLCLATCFSCHSLIALRNTKLGVKWMCASARLVIGDVLCRSIHAWMAKRS